MQKLLLKFFLLAAVAAFLVEAATVPKSQSKLDNAIKERESKGFKLLGSLKKGRTVTLFGKQSRILEDWFYWVGVNSAGWADAKKDCEENGDTLLCMETTEEVGNVTRWLQDTDNTGALYWVGGTYDVRSQSFIWICNEGRINPQAPWGPGQPKDSKPNTRVAASTVGREIELKTLANTQTTRYICEGERPDDGDQEQIPVPCYKDNDLVVVIDSSGSIGATYYEVAKEFTSRLATTWVDHAGSRVSVLIYSSDARTIFSLTDDQTVDVIKDKVYNMPYLGGGTASDLGINLAIDEFQKNNRAVTQNMVFLTDGQSNSRANTKAAADKAKALGIRAFSVGIGSGIGQDELLDIAGGSAERVFTTSQFEELLALLRPLSKKVCE